MIYYISGGQRSGKSSFAQNLALSFSQEPVYLATARVWDTDFADRVKRHQDDRDARWANLEEEKDLSKLDLDGRVVVLDCVTLWLTNYFVDTQYDVERSLKEAQTEWDKVCQKKCTLIVVSNEIGMGTHAETEIGRKFTDLQGWMNQYIARRADEAYFMVSGIPMKIK